MLPGSTFEITPTQNLHVPCKSCFRKRVQCAVFVRQSFQSCFVPSSYLPPLHDVWPIPSLSPPCLIPVVLALQRIRHRIFEPYFMHMHKCSNDIYNRRSAYLPPNIMLNLPVGGVLETPALGRGPIVAPSSLPSCPPHPEAEFVPNVPPPEVVLAHGQPMIELDTQKHVSCMPPSRSVFIPDKTKAH